MPERRPPGAPDISVVIPARDEEAFVATALASLETQRLPLEQLEAMVVANGCADRTADAVRTFAAQHPDLRLRLVELPTASVSAAKNRGAAEARGHLLLFLDADSRVAPDLLPTIWARATAGERAASIRLVGDTADALDRAFFRLIELKTLFGIRANMLYCERELFLDVAASTRPSTRPRTATSSSGCSGAGSPSVTSAKHGSQRRPGASTRCPSGWPSSRRSGVGRWARPASGAAGRTDRGARDPSAEMSPNRTAV